MYKRQVVNTPAALSAKAIEGSGAGPTTASLQDIRQDTIDPSDDDYYCFTEDDLNSVDKETREIILAAADRGQGSTNASYSQRDGGVCIGFAAALALAIIGGLAVVVFQSLMDWITRQLYPDMAKNCADALVKASDRAIKACKGTTLPILDCQKMVVCQDLLDWSETDEGGNGGDICGFFPDKQNPTRGIEPVLKQPGGGKNKKTLIICN